VTVYGYPRTGNQAPMLTIEGGGVTVGSNLAAGAAIFSWQHNGMEFVNINDYGRQIQTAYFSPHSDATGSWQWINPTEAGGMYTFISYALNRRQGSPVAAAYNEGLTQVTRSVPLDFNPSTMGGDAYHPVIWPTAVLGKNITLDWEGMGPVAKFESVLAVPADSANASMEVPTAYLTGAFDRFWTYDAAGEQLTEVFPVAMSELPISFLPASGYGGVILSTQDQQHALGIYAPVTHLGGSAATFVLFNFINSAQTDPTAFATSKWSVAITGAFETKYEYTFTSWLTSGTVGEVTAVMNQIKARGERGTPRIVPREAAQTPSPDALAELAVFRPSTGEWQCIHDAAPPRWVGTTVTTQLASFGSAQARALLGDVNGDGVDDAVIAEPKPSGYFDWTAAHSRNEDGAGTLDAESTSQIYSYGISGSAHVALFLADINGDGADDPVTVTLNGDYYTWRAQPSVPGAGLSDETITRTYAGWGNRVYGDQPLMADFNGDGLADIAYWRKGSGQWWIRLSTAGGLGAGASRVGTWGASTDSMALTGDVNGDGCADGVVMRPSGNHWQWFAAFADATGLIDGAGPGGSVAGQTFGYVSDIPRLADANGDGRADLCAIRDNGQGGWNWYFVFTGAGGELNDFAAAATSLGAPGDTAMIGQLRGAPVPAETGLPANHVTMY
jgi:hypothetical protein